MLRKLTLFLVLAALTAPLFAQDAEDLLTRRQYLTSSNRNINPLYQWAVWMQGQVAAGGDIGTGNIFYVDSNVTNEGDGTSWAKAKDTLNEAVDLCTANNGDVIMVAQGHNEALTAADGVDLDVAGITVIGCGEGSDRPRFDYDHADGEFVIGAPSVTIRNLTFLPSVNIVTHAIDIENAGDWAVIENCEFLEGEAAGTDEFVDCIQVGTTATNVTIRYNVYTSIAATTAPNNFVDLSAATISNPMIYGNVIKGRFAEAGIWAANAVPTDVFIAGNVIWNVTASQFCIEFQGNATGVIMDNICYSATEDYEVDPGTCFAWNNNEGKRLPEGTSLYDVTQNISTVGVTGAPTANTLADTLHKDGNFTYDNTTDSLEAIADSILTGTAVLGGINLDHLAKTTTGIAADADLTTMVAVGSILSHLMTNDATTADYDASTDSLEALSETLATILADTAAMDTAAEIQALVDPNNTIHDASRIISYTTEAMTVGNGYGAAHDPNIFTVTGTILARAFAVVTTKVTSTSNDTLELGVTGDTACLLIQDTADGTAFDANFCWTLDQAPDTTSAEMDTNWVLIPNGLDIKLFINDHDLTAGVVTFYLEWKPLSAGATAVPAAAASTQ
jgi:hypothetical protein